MSHAESGAGGMTNGGGSVSSAHKKMRRKRKELDALVAEDKLRRKSSSSSRHDLLHSDSDDVEFSGRGTDKNLLFGGVLGCLPGACALIVLLVTAVGVAATLRLLMATRRDLDALQMRLNAVEASGSELPAKFHESHVRLQQLEKNHTALWSTLSTINSNLEDVSQKLKVLESSIKVLQDSFSGSPQLSSLPKDVAAIQESVAAFGSSLQDVQSAVKSVKEEQINMHKKMQDTDSSIISIKANVNELYNTTQMPHVRTERDDGSRSINAVVVDLKTRVSDLSFSISRINSSLFMYHKYVDESKVQSIEQSFNASISSLRQKVDNVAYSINGLENEHLPSKVGNMTIELSILKESSDRHYKLLQNLTQNLAVVKGVEKKLEGSQLQLSSGVGDLKSQLHSLQRHLNEISSSTTSPVNQYNPKMMPTSDKEALNHPRKRRRVP